MILFFLQSVVAVFVVFTLTIWTASTFIFARPAKINWYAWGWGCVAIAAAAQALVWLIAATG
jgi:hypothetical protein